MTWKPSRVFSASAVAGVTPKPKQAAPGSAAAALLQGRSSISKILADWRAPKYAAQARAFSWPALRAALRRLAACDLAIKGIEGGDDKHVALELLVTSLCARPRRRARV